jgi:hypothetical protein
MNLQQVYVRTDILLVALFDWFVGLVFLLGWTKDEATMYSFPTNSAPKPHKIFCGPVFYYRMTK